MGNYVAREMKRLMGKAIHSQQMIEDGDHVLVFATSLDDRVFTYPPVEAINYTPPVETGPVEIQVPIEAAGEEPSEQIYPMP